MKNRIWGFLVTFAFGLWLTPSAWSTPGDSHSDADICPQFHLGTTRDLAPGTTVKICDQFYDSAPLVRIPEKDSTSTPSQITFYGALDSLSPTGAIISDRNGGKFFVLNAKGEVSPTYDYSALPSTMLMPSQLYLYLIYKIRGKIAPIPSSATGIAPGARGLIIVAATPVIYVPGSLMDGYLPGSWEGFVNLRIRNPADIVHVFDPKSPRPLRIEITAIKPLQEPLASQVLGVWPDKIHQGMKFQDVSISNATGVVENFDTDVLSSTGSCVPSLASLKQQNPFLGATSGDVDFYRFPGMHGAGSEAFVMIFPPGTQGTYPTGMSLPFFMKASTLISSHPRFVINEFPHGIHNGFEIGGLHKVTGGGGACSGAD